MPPQLANDRTTEPIAGIHTSPMTNSVGIATIVMTTARSPRDRRCVSRRWVGGSSAASWRPAWRF